MNASTRSFVLQICLAVASTTPVLAARIPAFTAAEEASCQQAIGLAQQKFVSAAVKSWASCYDGEGAGHNACASIVTAAAEARLQAQVARKCDAVGGFWRLGLGANLAEALDAIVPGSLGAADKIADSAYALTYGSPGVQPVKTTDPALFRCLTRLGKEARTIAKGVMRTDTRCLDQDDALQVTDPSRLPRCDEAPRIATLAHLIDGAARRIESACSAGQLFAATGNADARHFAEGVANTARRAVCGAYSYARNLAICPTPPGEISLRRLAGTVDFGWKAQAHGGTIPPGLPATIELLNCIHDVSTTCNLYAPSNGLVSLVTPTALPPIQGLPDGAYAVVVSSFTTDLTGSITFDDAHEIQQLKITQGQKVEIRAEVPIAEFPFCCVADFPPCSGGLGDRGTCSAGTTPGEPCIVDAVFPEGPTSTSCVPRPGGLEIRPELTTARSEPLSLAATFPCLGSAGNLCHCPSQLKPNECSDAVCSTDETCAQEPSTACFPGVITRTGAAEPLTVAAVGCAVSDALDALLGFPGPFAVSQQLEVEITMPPN